MYPANVRMTGLNAAIANAGDLQHRESSRCVTQEFGKFNHKLSRCTASLSHEASIKPFSIS
jgi:hypothetical protein